MSRTTKKTQTAAQVLEARRAEFQANAATVRAYLERRIQQCYAAYAALLSLLADPLGPGAPLDRATYTANMFVDYDGEDDEQRADFQIDRLIGELHDRQAAESHGRRSAPMCSGDDGGCDGLVAKGHEVCPYHEGKAALDAPASDRDALFKAGLADYQASVIGGDRDAPTWVPPHATLVANLRGEVGALTSLLWATVAGVEHPERPGGLLALRRAYLALCDEHSAGGGNAHCEAWDFLEMYERARAVASYGGKRSRWCAQKMPGGEKCDGVAPKGQKLCASCAAIVTVAAEDEPQRTTDAA